MPPVIQCPDAAELRRFATGHLSPDDAGPIEAHLDGCAACVAALRTLPADDTLSDAVRAGVTIDLHPEQEVVSSLTEQVKALAAGAARPTDDTSAASESSGDDDLAAV